MLKVAILSTSNSPLLSMLVYGLETYNKIKFYILLDKKKLNEKNLNIWRERTNGKLDKYINSFELFRTKNISKYSFESHNDNSCIRFIKKNKINWIINCGSPRKISPEFLETFRNRVVNLHPGLLPYYRGSCCVEWAIYNGDKVGNTIHLMTEEYDEGAILLIESYNIKKFKDYKEVRILVYKRGIKLFHKFFNLLQNEKLKNIDYNYTKIDHIYKPITDEKLNKVKQIISNQNINNKKLKIK